MPSIWIGFDPRESAAYAVARDSIESNLTQQIPVRGVVLDYLRQEGLYTRPTTTRLGRLYDEISQHEMATEFAISRFLVPHLANDGWALFADCDVLARGNLARLFDYNSDHSKYAVMCVKHDYQPQSLVKMDLQRQSTYARKNWSSVMMFNCDHPSNRKLTLELINSVPGRDLHRFCWLEDHEIGELGPEWNWIPGHSDKTIDPKIVHYTEGGPWLEAFKSAPYADEWRGYLNRWAA